MIRRDHIVDDIQTVLMALLAAKQSDAPWSSWAVVRGFPNIEILETYSRPVVYVCAPEWMGQLLHAGGQPSWLWRVTVGAWDDRKTGGPRELNMIMSAMLDFFSDPQTCHTQRFDVRIGGAVYGGTTLPEVGVRVEAVEGPREMMTVDDGEFRAELAIVVRT